MPNDASSKSSHFRQHTRWLIGGVVLFAVSYYRTISRGLSGVDESWFLLVLHRVTSGEILYRDIFFGATPLSVYLATPFVQTFGPEILVVKGLAALCFVGTVFLCCRIVRQINAVQGVPWLVILALLQYAPPSEANSGSLYSPLAILFLLCCLSATLSWWQGGKVGFGGDRFRDGGMFTLAVAGGAAGLCFASKQNIGVYTLAALLVAVVIGPLREQDKRLRDAIIVLAVFVLVVTVVLLPVWLSGGYQEFLDYGFLGKGTYLRAWKDISYVTWLLYWLSAPWPSSPLEQYYRVEECLLFLLPLVTFSALAMAWVRANSQDRLRLTGFLCFVIAAFLIVFPLGNHFQLVGAVPVLLLGLAYAWSRLRLCSSRVSRRRAAGFLYLWLCVGVGIRTLEPLVNIAAGGYTVSTVPHFRGVILPKATDSNMRAAGEILLESTGKWPTLLISAEAPLLYLISGLKNPTPFDYPMRAAFGSTGEDEVVAALSRGQIHQVCLGMSVTDSWAPHRIVDFVLTQMELGPRLGVCVLYQRRA